LFKRRFVNIFFEEKKKKKKKEKQIKIRVLICFLPYCHLACQCRSGHISNGTACIVDECKRGYCRNGGICSLLSSIYFSYFLELLIF